MAPLASPTPRPECGDSSVDGGGGDAGSVMQKIAARKYSPATTTMTASGPATLTTSGPSRAKPSAKAALRVSVKIPFAARSCERGTSTGIIASSAGAKKTVIVEIATLSSRMTARFVPARYSATNARPRRRFVAIRIRRRSIRSTYTPATAENSTAGTRKVRMRMLTAVLEPLELTMMVSPKRTMLPPIWVDACDSQRRRNPLLRKTASGPASCGSVATSAVTRPGRWWA